MGRLSRFRRLTQQGEFDRVYKRADKVWHTPWFVLFFRRDEGQGVAFVAGKKVGKAVQRNRAKRLLRALFIGSLDELGPGIYILVAKAPILDVKFSELQKGWQIALRRSGALRPVPRKS